MIGYNQLAIEVGGAITFKMLLIISNTAYISKYVTFVLPTLPIPRTCFLITIVDECQFSDILTHSILLLHCS
ncbi:hypothetical protein BV22DRAFT_1029265 [Leucogyrophana mollusca]|uniref:Uncharacterized protein n=1 Tax=Leucogyrophana mollusca TaxID=85980 RepID=A0ACB8BX46_9AGAM|nr:hypothetical protein BV22DRAFT_1029265 [Leucogyrophana mollusca]